MSKQQLVEAIHELDSLGVIVQRESDEALTEALEELDLVDND